MLAIDLDRLTKQSFSTARSMHLKSALNPVLWLCCVTVPTLLAFAWLFSSHLWLCEVLALSAIGVTFLSVGAFWYFAVKRPEQLRSEEFQLRQQALQIYREKTGKVRAIPMSFEQILIPPTEEK